MRKIQITNEERSDIKHELELALLQEDILGTLGSALGLTGDKKEEPEKKEPEKQQQESKKALVFGHSQSGGMGLDFVKILKGQGYDVTRVTKVGAGDRQLGSMIPSETGDPAQYDKVFYFAGANMPGPPGTITANVNKLGGPSKVTVILAPYNMSKEPPDLLSDPNTKGYKNEQELKSAGIRVYRPLFPPDVFWGDRVHVKPGTSIGLEFANNAISGVDNKYSNPSTAKTISTDFLSDLKKAITSSGVYKAIKGFFTSKKTGALDSSESLMKFKAHLNNKQDEMADLIYYEFTSAGLSANIALAAIINAYKESGLNPNSEGDSGHSIGLFQLHDRGGGSGMSVEERRDPKTNIQKMIKIIKGSFGRKLRAADEQGKSVPVLAAIFSRDVERPKNREGNMISRSKLASKWLGIDNVVDQSNVDQVDSMVAEAKNKKGKDDRCVRIAKSKYDAWPSAYASGAVVKCRQGKIWKDIKEEAEELEEEKKLKRKLKKGIASALATMTAVLPPPDAIQSAKGKKPSEIIKKDKEELEEEWSDKYKRSIDCKNPKGFSQKAHCQGRKKNEGNDPKVGTGKKPEGSSRRLYTDEDPSDTVSVKFSTVQDIKDTLSKESFKSKSHARQSQIINLIHQRVRAAHENAKDPETKARLRIALDYAEKRKEASKKKTASLQKKEEILTEKCWEGYTQKGMKTMFGKKYPNCVKKTNEEVELEERKLGKPSSETSLRDWFKRKGAPGKRGGWVDCNTCRNGKCSPCGRQGGEKRSKYPRCRPTPAQCKGYKRRGDNLQKEAEEQ